MKNSTCTRRWPWLTVLCLMIHSGCATRPTEPLVLTEPMGPLPIDFSAADCHIPVLSTPPDRPHEVIARVKTYGNPETGSDTMRTVLLREACNIGAHAVILEKVKGGKFVDEIAIQTDSGIGPRRHYDKHADYAFQLIGLAIRYTPDK